VKSILECEKKEQQEIVKGEINIVGERPRRRGGRSGSPTFEIKWH
jgi:hypothetical protein